jgi:hypothetical protein
VRLDGALLDQADLNNISWNENTTWETSQGIKRAINVPEKLKQQLGL